jgi:HlyD family secretion protein
VAGEVEEILVKVGAQVKAGDPIARLDAELFEVDLKTAETALQSAKLQMVKIKAGARPEEIAAAKSALNIAQAALSDKELRVASCPS